MTGPLLARRPAVVPLPEPYVGKATMAGLLGIGVRSLDRWVVEGCPSETWGMKRTRRFLPSAVVAWARERDYAQAGPVSEGGAGNQPKE